MAEQVTGVLREVLAAEDGRSRPAVSTVFGPEREVFGGETDSWPAPLDHVRIAAALPVPLVQAEDPAAGFLASTAGTDPERLVATLAAAPVSSAAVTIALACAMIAAGDLVRAIDELDALEKTDDADWRITWCRGLAAMAGGEPVAARAWFDLVYSLLPGEPAAKLALAASEECLGNAGSAAWLYERVWRTDPAYVSAAFGLARTRLRQGDRDGAVAAAESVPPTSSHHLAAQLAAIRARMPGIGPDQLAEHYLVEAGDRLAALELDVERAAKTRIDLLNAAHAWVSSNGHGFRGRGTVLGSPLNDRSVRRQLEQQYRALARLARTKDVRRALVDRANSVRPVTWL
jgi:serine/threonine-protein kinase PknG